MSKLGTLKEIFTLEIVPNELDSIEIIGDRQYDHNALIANMEPPISISGPILLDDKNYEFNFEIRTIYDTTNWIFSLDGFLTNIIT